MEKFVINLDEKRKEEFLRLLAENGFGEVMYDLEDGYFYIEEHEIKKEFDRF